MESVLAILLGIGLAASCGFRVFVPMLIVSIAARTGYLHLAEGFAWMGGWPAVIAFAVATLLEVVAYYVPWLDNALDAAASPVAVIAGTVLFAALVTDLDPLLKWALAVIAGGGSAGIVQGGTVATRLASTAATGGAGNFIVNTVETVAGFVFAILSLLAPVIAVTLLVAAVIVLYYIGRRIIRRWLRARSPCA
jgi:hypothetical protein